MAATESLTFEKIWVMLQENREQMREEMRKSREELREQMKETERRIGELGNRFGEMVEHLVSPGIMNKFNELNFTFEQESANIKIKDSSGRCIAEIDLLLENGDTVMAVEVKAKPAQKDVDTHASRMEILRCRADARNDKRKFQGAIAGAIMSEEVKDYAHKIGFYVIEQTGDTIKISIPEDFVAREW